MSVLSPKDAQRLLSLDDDALYTDLGVSLQAGTLGADEIPPEESKQIGARWLQKHLESLRSAVCSDARIRQVVETHGDLVTLAMAVADVITSLCVGVSVGTVSCILVKIGLARLCKTEWA